ncbi:hypothetical protein LK459_15755 [Gordonia otitidis]|uniref:hypothetical protein n=1 Tax=Gordonia otitidis TaxID=249058 RepID=UPI001D1465F0|nr:hypothetical protein [Gordonia otitidis]UEA58044.1 hypothetical protein LK459_15755 [Gordonia otitidis]
MSALVVHHRVPRRTRGVLVAVSVLLVVAIVVAATAWLGVRATRPSPDAAARSALLGATERIVAQTLRTTPDMTRAQRLSVAAGLTDPLGTRYALDGADAVLPGAVAGRLTVDATVVGAGVAEYSPPDARVLVLVDEVLAGDTKSDTRTPIARWAHMRNVDGNWLLADLTPVGDVTR